MSHRTPKNRLHARQEAAGAGVTRLTTRGEGLRGWPNRYGTSVGVPCSAAGARDGIRRPRGALIACVVAALHLSGRSKVRRASPSADRPTQGAAGTGAATAVLLCGRLCAARSDSLPLLRLPACVVRQGRRLQNSDIYGPDTWILPLPRPSSAHFRLRRF